jgi:hypothetical protein
MRPTRITQTGAGSTAPIVLNKQIKASVACIVDGTVDYTVQVTFDDVFAPDFDAATATWFPHPDTALVGASTNQRGVIDFPIIAVRATVNSGAGSVDLVVVQDEKV